MCYNTSKWLIFTLSAAVCVSLPILIAHIDLPLPPQPAVPTSHFTMQCTYCLALFMPDLHDKPFSGQWSFTSHGTCTLIIPFQEFCFFFLLSVTNPLPTPVAPLVKTENCANERSIDFSTERVLSK